MSKPRSNRKAQQRELRKSWVLVQPDKTRVSWQPMADIMRDQVSRLGLLTSTDRMLKGG